MSPLHVTRLPPYIATTLQCIKDDFSVWINRLRVVDVFSAAIIRDCGRVTVGWLQCVVSLYCSSLCSQWSVCLSVWRGACYLPICIDVCQSYGIHLARPCKRDGYQDPKNCWRCRCPDGFAGHYCETVASGVDGEWVTVVKKNTNSNNKSCWQLQCTDTLI